MPPPTANPSATRRQVTRPSPPPTAAATALTCASGAHSAPAVSLPDALAPAAPVNHLVTLGQGGKLSKAQLQAVKEADRLMDDIPWNDPTVGLPDVDLANLPESEFELPDFDPDRPCFVLLCWFRGRWCQVDGMAEADARTSLYEIFNNHSSLLFDKGKPKPSRIWLRGTDKLWPAGIAWAANVVNEREQAEADAEEELYRRGVESTLRGSR